MDVTIILEILIFMALMGLSAFFSSSETSLFSLNHLQLEQMRRDGNANLGLIERLLSQITPKTLAIRNNVAFASTQSRFIDLFARLIAPLRWIVRHIADFFITLIVGKERSRANILTEDMVRSLTAEAVGQGALDHVEALYINRIFDFGDKSLREVMTPRSRISFLRANATLRDAAAKYQRTGHTKVPIHDGAKDSVVGVPYARDLLDKDLKRQQLEGSGGTVAELMREAYFVPESKSVADLFYTFRKRKISLALTIDEFGGVTGLVTMEDVLECIFGEIISGSELLQQRRVDVEEFGEQGYRIDGSMTIEQFNRLLRTNFETQSVDTIGGLVLEAFRELPSEGQSIIINGYEFTVVSVVGRRVTVLAVELASPPKSRPTDLGAGWHTEVAVEASSAMPVTETEE